MSGAEKVGAEKVSAGHRKGNALGAVVSGFFICNSLFQGRVRTTSFTGTLTRALRSVAYPQPHFTDGEEKSGDLPGDGSAGC